MHEDKPFHGKPKVNTNRDITPILEGWEYESGSINVRKIMGLDGAPKLQMRQDLGLMQMEMSGRPDGRKPHGCESLLDYFERQQKRHYKRHGTDEGFFLTGRHCQELREEALMYYHRYLSLFVLGDFAGVARDTARNLRVLDLCGRYAAEEQDRFVLEQYRPYIIMMHSRALASIEIESQNFRSALRIVKRAMRAIKEFFTRFGQEEAYGQSNEVKILRRFKREIRKNLPQDPMRLLEKRLTRAVKEERYEEAAQLRDEIQQLKSGPQA